ncbi:MAG: YfhO family protein [Bacteroidales bacterium]|nr:YfhO family protein [Bacteroidales bacterium]
MKEFFKKYGVFFVAAAIFILLSIIYCKPALSGRVIQSSDNVNGLSAVQEGVRYHKETGDYTWWTGSMFCGMPNYQIGGGHYASSTLLAPFSKILKKGCDNPVWTLIIYFFCFFVLLRSFDVGRWTSIAGSIALTFSSYFIVIIAAGHGGKTASIALVSVVMAGMQYIFKGRYLLGSVLSSLFMAVGFSIHPQMTYYLFMMMGVLWIAWLVGAAKSGALKKFAISTGIFAATVLLGLGCGSANVFANAEYASQTMRGGHSDLSETPSQSKGLDIEYATQWSYGIDETLSFLIPGIKGGANAVDVGKKSILYRQLVRKGVPSQSAASFCSQAPMYWGEQPFTAGNVYMGAVVCFLFVVGLSLVKGPLKWALAISTLLSVMLAWGYNFIWLTQLFFKYFPLYSKFRAVSSILIVAEIAMPLLGFIALERILQGKVEKKDALRSIGTGAAVTGGICLFFALFGTSVYDFTSVYDQQWKGGLEWAYPYILEQRASILQSDSWRSLAFIAAAAAVLWLFVSGKIRKPVVTAAIGVMVLFDLWGVDRRYFNDSCFVSARSSGEAYAMKPYEKLLLQDEDPNFRVYNLAANTFNDARTSYYLKSVGGYSAAKLRRYQDLIDRHLSKGNIAVVNMLNVKYFIVDRDGVETPVPNPDAFGNAWYVSRLCEASSSLEESDALDRLDLRTEAVYGREFADMVEDDEPGIASDASVSLVSYTTKQLEYVCSSSQPGTIVFSEIYYPFGWKASIDGQPCEHFRVNYVLRALNVPAGQHSISFVFDPDSVRKGDVLSVICIAILYLLMAFAAVVAVRKVRKNA